MNMGYRVHSQPKSSNITMFILSSQLALMGESQITSCEEVRMAKMLRREGERDDYWGDRLRNSLMVVE